MKKLVSILLVLGLVFSFTACGSDLPEPDENTLVFKKKELQSKIDKNESALGQKANKGQLELIILDANYKDLSSISPNNDFLVYAVLDEENQKFKVYATTEDANGEVAITDFIDDVPKYEWTDKSDLIIRLNGTKGEEKK